MSLNSSHYTDNHLVGQPTHSCQFKCRTKVYWNEQVNPYLIPPTMLTFSPSHLGGGATGPCSHKQSSLRTAFVLLHQDSEVCLLISDPCTSHCDIISSSFSRSTLITIYCLHYCAADTVKPTKHFFPCSAVLLRLLVLNQILSKDSTICQANIGQYFSLLTLMASIFISSWFFFLNLISR